MNIVAEIKTILTDLNFPAQKQDVINHAQSQGANGNILSMLKQLPEQTFGNIEELLSKLPLGNIGKDIENLL